MHSGSSISPKHPAIPVSIGIASLVLEGRSSALDDSSIHATSASHGTGSGDGGGGTDGGAGHGGGGSGESANGTGGTDEDGGFGGSGGGVGGGKRRSSTSGGEGVLSSGSSSGTTSTLQQCSLMAISEAHKLQTATCHMSDASQRINLKLQQIRSSCPGTSKDEVHHLVTVSGESSSGRGGGVVGRGGRGTLEDEDDSRYGDMYGLESFVSSTARFVGGGGSTPASWSHEAASCTATSSAVIYSGFEKMNVLATVSPIKNHPNSFINFSSSSPSASSPNASIVAAAAAAAAAVASSSSTSSSGHARKPTCSSSSSSSAKQQQQQQPQRPREGPHCEQFLKKIGLNKPDAADGPEHSCSYRNKYCLRWQVYFKQLSSILTNGEAVCIEVYLGPENHTILLEQWILKLVMTKSPTAMTLQSLCAAIRSQLYFSQISAWTDLIKNSLEPDLFNHPRIRKMHPPATLVTGHGAGKKVPTPFAAKGGPSVSSSSSPPFRPQAKLDILFRIRTYDSTACFNEKPLVHNFPDANVADGFVIQVCLKSLPRLDRIPGIHAALDAAKMFGVGTGGGCGGGGGGVGVGGGIGVGPGSGLLLLQGDRLELPCHEKGKHRCAFRELELEEEDDGEGDDPRMVDGEEGAGMLLTSAAINHREKQLLKYKKRMLKREKKKKSGTGVAEGRGGYPVAAVNGGVCGSNTSSSSSSSSTSSGNRNGRTSSHRNGSSVDSSSAYVSPMSYSSCSNGSGGGGGGGGKNNSASVGPYGCGTPLSNGIPSVYVNVGSNGTTTTSCTNGNCGNALTSSINSIQPPLYSSSNQAHHHTNAMLMCCDDRYHTIATNSKSTQTSSAVRLPTPATAPLPFVSSVATQTEGGGAGAPIVYCTDCCRSSREEKPAADFQPNHHHHHQSPSSQGRQVFVTETANGTRAGGQGAVQCGGGSGSNGATAVPRSEVVLATGGSSTNSDRHMQYFNDYYRSYDIINDNCDKRQATPQPAAATHRRAAATCRRVTDAPMEETVAAASRDDDGCPRRRACFIVGGDGYDGDEDGDVVDSAGGGESTGDPRMPNGVVANDCRPPLQKGDLLLQAIQRTATLNGGGGGANQNGSFVVVQEKEAGLLPGATEKHTSAAGVVLHAMNNNNYATTNNNNVGECGNRGKENGGTEANGGQTGPTGAGSADQHQRHQLPHHLHGGGGGGSGGMDGSVAPPTASAAAALCERSECDTLSKEKLDLGDCRLCKRQKTKHNFKLNLTDLLSSAAAAAAAVAVAPRFKPAIKKTLITTVVDCGSPPGCRRTLSESLVGHLTIPECSGPGGSEANGTKAAGGGGGCGASNGSTNGRYDGRYHHHQNGDLSPGDSPMLSSSTGAVGNGGVFTFEQMKSYRRAFSEDVIDTLTTSSAGAGRSLMASGRGSIVTAEDDSTEEDDTSGENENDEHELLERGPKRCGCAGSRLRSNCGARGSPLAVDHRAGSGPTPHHRQHTSTPAAAGSSEGEGGKCEEPLYISCSETDCSVSTASSVSPHKKQILSCGAIGAGAGNRSSEAGRASFGLAAGGAMNVKQLMQYKSSPKINLNYVFCLSPLARDDSGFTSGSSPATSTSFPATSPIAIDGGLAGGGGSGGGSFGECSSKSARCQNSRQGGGGGLFRYDFEENPISPVSGTMKSKSAPAFPFSPPSGALSPRFLRNAQQQRLHRTRYPSERSSVSERSSIGSDEQLSDDDLSYLLDSSNGYSPLSSHQMSLMSGSPMKLGQPARSHALLTSSQMLSKVLNRNLFKFGRAPLLGTLEESLLQRRLSPKFQVADFKVLLGASGSFCPTQLTIPVASYFYELPGQHLTTPYVCELRLPRKGYSIPRTGTVQATLLNPLGTVVRMFVVPYDFRDMPAMSTTFIRQRILACDESSLQLLGKNIEQLSNAEQMKLLRYAIHLRFQTSRSGKLSLHTDIRLLISRRTDCDTAAAHAKNLLESPNELKVVTIVPENPKFSLRIDKQ